MRLGCKWAGAAWAGSRGSAYRATSRLLVFIVVLLSSMLMVVPAYALSDHPGVEINGWNLEKFGMDGRDGFLVYAPDRFSAAALSLGYSWDEVQGFTYQQRSYMTNASTGGDFFTYAQRFEELSASTPSFGENAHYAWAMGYLQTNQVIFGGRVYTDAWAINTTSEWRSDAKQKIRDIIDGNVGGGGGGTSTPPTVDGDTVILSFPLYYGVNSDSTYRYVMGSTTYYFNSLSPQMPSPVYVRITKSAYDELTSHENWFMGLYPNNNYQGLILYYGYVPDSDGASFSWVVGSNGMKYFHFDRKDGHTGSYTWYENTAALGLESTANNVLYLRNTSSTFSYSLQWKNASTNSESSSRPVYAMLGSGGGGGGGGTTDPPNNWPDPPNDPTPEPPDVPSPEPPDEPIEPDPPIQPITPYPDPPVVVEPTPPQTVDLSDLLEALDNHCLHLRNALHSEFANFDTDFRSQMAWLATVIDDAIYGLDVDIGSYFAHLEGYLEDLANWLADQFEFSVDGYDDSSLITWLKSIFAKMGTGSTNTRPVDPATDPIGIGDWLEQLFSNFTGDLNDIGSSELESTVTEYRALSTKFPVCIPWDLYNMLSLLVAEPVTPVIDFPWFALTSSGLVSNNVRINLAAWDTTMVPVRLMEKLTYCMFLATRSKDLLSLFRLGRGD